MSKESLRKSLTWKDLRELIKLSTKRKYNRVLNIDFLFTNIKENYNLTSDDDNINADISTGISSEEFKS